MAFCKGCAFAANDVLSSRPHRRVFLDDFALRLLSKALFLNTPLRRRTFAVSNP